MDVWTNGRIMLLVLKYHMACMEGKCKPNAFLALTRELEDSLSVTACHLAKEYHQWPDLYWYGAEWGQKMHLRSNLCGGCCPPIALHSYDGAWWYCIGAVITGTRAECALTFVILVENDRVCEKGNAPKVCTLLKPMSRFHRFLQIITKLATINNGFWYLWLTVYSYWNAKFSTLNIRLRYLNAIIMFFTFHIFNTHEIL